MAKKIFALVASVVLVVCFAVTVSAVHVGTTTTYVAGGQASVEVTVSDVTENNNVTYYATNGDEIFVDQKKVAEGETSVVFNYETAIANVGSEVKVGYTNSNAEEGTIPDADKYAIKYDGATLASVYPGEGANVTINYTPAAYTTVTGVTATNATVTAWSGQTEISVTLSNVQGEVELAVVTEAKEIPGYTEELVIAEAAAIVVGPSEDPYYEGGIKIDGVVTGEGDNEVTDPMDSANTIKVNADKEGDRKLTVCGKAGAFDNYGIIVSKAAITSGSYRVDAFEGLGEVYEAMDKAPNNMFAVQLIDTSDKGADTSFVVEGTPYYTAVYGYVAANQAYYVVSLDTPVTAVAAN